jgi:hypothetical protein
MMQEQGCKGEDARERGRNREFTRVMMQRQRYKGEDARKGVAEKQGRNREDSKISVRLQKA